MHVYDTLTEEEMTNSNINYFRLMKNSQDNESTILQRK